MPYTKTTEFPSHGFPDSTNDMTGGSGFKGMEQLNQFAEMGGVIISLDNSSKILAEAGVGRELEENDAPGLFHPGSVVNVKIRKKDNPVLYGFPEVFPIGPIMGMPDNKETAPASDSSKKEIHYVLSGMVRNEQAIIGHGAIFNIPIGSGRLIAFTFDPLHRYLNLHDAVLVWNTLINWDYLHN